MASCTVLLDFAMIPTVLPVKAISNLKHNSFTIRYVKRLTPLS